MKALLSSFIILFSAHLANSQDINAIVQKAKDKIANVNDYQATGRMKTNVAFLKVPVANVQVYFKKPNRLKVKSEKGISFIPKGAVSINMNNILNEKFTIIDGGVDNINGVVVRVAKLLPDNENSDVVLSTIYIDPVTSLIRKSKTTTRDNGTYELNLSYGKFSGYGLPDKVVFSFNTKDYKLPKGVTFDFDDGSIPKTPKENKNRKGRAEIVFNNYIVNKGVPDQAFH